MTESPFVTSEPLSPIPERSACAVKLTVFEGPLDLLLHLIRINEVDISNIPIAEISEQYLEYLDLMRSLDIDVAAEYLLMAATLAHIKSRMLLPAVEGDEEEGVDPRAELARRLAEYAIFRDAGEDLGRRPVLGRDVFAVTPDRSEQAEPEALLQVSLFDLLEALRRALARIPAESRVHEVSIERVTLQDRMMFVMDCLRGAPGGNLLFEDLLLDPPLSRHKLVMSFLAILELARIQVIRLFQNQTPEGRPFGPVRVRLAVSEDGERLSEGSDVRGG